MLMVAAKERQVENPWESSLDCVHARSQNKPRLLAQGRQTTTLAGTRLKSAGDRRVEPKPTPGGRTAITEFPDEETDT